MRSSLGMSPAPVGVFVGRGIKHVNMEHSVGIEPFVPTCQKGQLMLGFIGGHGDFGGELTIYGRSVFF